MESNLAVMSKRVWNMVRVVYFMLRKGISKGKLMMDLNMMLKRRGKLAGKAIANLISFHHHGSSRRSNDSRSHTQFSASNREYEFSCSNTPNYTFLGKRNRHHHHNSNNFFTCAHAPPTRDDEVMTVNAVKAVLEMLNNNETTQGASPSPPALPGFGKSPMVSRQLRVTDSPFPLRELDEDNNHNHEEEEEEVDKAAEDFINRFYSQLRRQH